MSQQRIRKLPGGVLHRIAVDWAADTFGLRVPDARTRHENARFRAHARAASLHGRARSAARANARALPARLHAERGEPRVLPAWQARIGRHPGHDAHQGDITSTSDITSTTHDTSPSHDTRPNQNGGAA